LSNEDTCRLVWRFSQHARRTETVQSLLGEAVPLLTLFGQRSHSMCTYLGLWMDKILQAWDKLLDIDWRVLLRYMPPAARRSVVRTWSPTVPLTGWLQTIHRMTFDTQYCYIQC
jgi:hypothetical protein